MRIALIGDFTGTPDEGMKNISSTVYNRLAKNHDVFAMNPFQALSVHTLLQLKLFRPHVIHYLHGPTIRSLGILAWLKLITRAPTLVSATRPYLPPWTRKILPLVCPDLVLTQSRGGETLFKNLGSRVSFFPNGVDMEKFSPVNPREKANLRSRLNLPLDQKIILHVGHIKPNRQLDIFFRIQKMEGIQVVIAGGTHEPADIALKEKLIRAGIRVVHEYMPDISMLYKAADLYLFPIMDKPVDKGEKQGTDYNSIGAIDLPLSVFEAMACDLPVLTTPFGALPRLFNQDPLDPRSRGFVYADTDTDLLGKIWPMLDSGRSGTRAKVSPFAWPKVINYLEQHYQGLVRRAGPRAVSYSNTPGMAGKESHP